MQPFHKITSHLVNLPHNNVDTDQIIPARYLKVTDKEGLAEGLFSGWRFQADGNPDPSFPLNKPESEGAQILLTGDNFGSGSSREHAPWALAGWGIRALISTSFADIFRNNAMKNGLLPVVVDKDTYQELVFLWEKDPLAQVTIDLERQTIKYGMERSVRFEIDAFNKTCLLEGMDVLNYLLAYETEIGTYETARIK
jgi:3-isopropylmalate/(R)-2-methylmalate dehydratase small subunit